LRHEVSIDVAAPIERAWEVLIDVERWPEWTASISKIERLDTGELRVGSKVRIRQPKLPRKVWTVTAIEPGREVEWSVKTPVLDTVGGHRLAAERAGCRLTLALEQNGLLRCSRSSTRA
jgi:uncharacterized membrane protein